LRLQAPDPGQGIRLIFPSVSGGVPDAVRRIKAGCSKAE
jgi:hypothetical protein